MLGSWLSKVSFTLQVAAMQNHICIFLLQLERPKFMLKLLNLMKLFNCFSREFSGCKDLNATAICVFFKASKIELSYLKKNKSCLLVVLPSFFELKRDESQQLFDVQTHLASKIYMMKSDLLPFFLFSHKSNQVISCCSEIIDI